MNNKRIKIGCILIICFLTISGVSVSSIKSIENNFEIVHVQNIEPVMAPDLAYYPIDYDFGTISEGTIYKTTFDIWNIGTDTLIWSLISSESWLSFDPITGDSTGEIDTILVEIDTTGLTPGSYIGKIGINANIPGGPYFFAVYFDIDYGTNSPPDTPDDLIGPTIVQEGVEYLYYTCAIEPDGDPIRYGFDFDNDGIIIPEHWTSYNEPNVTIPIEITFYGTGIRYIRVKAEDIYGFQSNFSNPLTVAVTGSNDPPETPSKPSGPDTGEIDTSYTYSTSTIDPDDDILKYGWDWNGDGFIDEWSNLVDSGSVDTRFHSWSTPGTYYVQVLAEDEHGGQSAFSSARTVVILSNHEPAKPTISGPSSGRIGKSYIYSSMGTDPDGDQIYYWFDWGDGFNSGWTGPYNSGQSASESHSWSAQGTYSVKVKTKDSNNIESIWSDAIPVSMPKINQFLFIQFLMEKYPIIYHLLSAIYQ